jgi:hypothetical protein
MSNGAARELAADWLKFTDGVCDRFQGQDQHCRTCGFSERLHTKRDCARQLASACHLSSDAAEESVRHKMQLIETCAELMTALARYGVHEDGCAAWPQFTGHVTGATKVGACTCGLSAALEKALAS